MEDKNTISQSVPSPWNGLGALKTESEKCEAKGQLLGYIWYIIVLRMYMKISTSLGAKSGVSYKIMLQFNSLIFRGIHFLNKLMNNWFLIEFYENTHFKQ